MTRRPTRRARLLDVVAAVGLSAPALMVLDSYDTRPAAVSIAVIALLLAATVVWIAWRRSGQRSRTGAVAFAVIATATISLGNGPLFYGIVWTACLALGVTFSSSLVLWGYTAVLVILVVALHVSTGSPVERTAGEAIAALFSAGIGAAVTAVLRDSLRVDEALRTTLDRLQEANTELRGRLDRDRDLVLARERERTARELHDGLGHRLTAIGLSLDYAGRIDDPLVARAELQRARALVGESLDAMRRLVRAIHPVELSSLRNADAFRAVADAFRGTGLAIHVSIEGDDDALDHERALLLLRFVQEGLTNVVRHSDAAEVRLRITVGTTADAVPPGVRAVLEDRATPAPAAPLVEGFGLRSLRGRAESLGGTLVASPTPTGFRLTLELPDAGAPVVATAGVPAAPTGARA